MAISRRTKRWFERRKQWTDSQRSEYLGPRILSYIRIWQALSQDRWRSVKSIMRDSGVGHSRQVRRVLMALEHVGVVEHKREKMPDGENLTGFISRTVWRRTQ